MRHGWAQADQRVGRQDVRVTALARRFSWVGLTSIFLACFLAFVRAKANPQALITRLPERCWEAGKTSARTNEMLEALARNPSANMYNTLGTLFAQDKVTDCAIDAFEMALRLDPDAWEARYNLGLALISHQDYERAVEELQLAVKANPGSFDAHNALGVANRALGKFATATVEFERTLSLNPRFADASLNLADVDIEEKRYVAAISCLKQALANSPSRQSAVSLERDLGVAYFQNQEYEKAAAVFKKLTSDHPDSALFHFNLANCYAHYEEFANAASEYKEVLRLEPKNDIARLSLAKALLSLNSISESLPYLREYIRNQPQDPEGYEIEGRAYRRLGRFAEAVVVLRRAVTLDAKSYVARYDLGFCLAQFGETDEAIEQFRAAARLEPNAPENGIPARPAAIKERGRQSRPK